jgi:hypothetical protein
MRSHLIEAITELAKGPLYPWIEPGAKGRSREEVANDLLKEEAFMRRDYNDVGYPLTRLDRKTLRITYVMITA